MLSIFEKLITSILLSRSFQLSLTNKYISTFPQKILMEGFLNFLKQLIRYQLHFNNPFFDPF